MPSTKSNYPERRKALAYKIWSVVKTAGVHVPTSGGSRSIPGVEDPQPMATDTYAIGHPPNQRTLFIQFYHTPDWDISVTVTFPGTSPLPPFIIRNDSEATPVLEHIRALLESPNVA